MNALELLQQSPVIPVIVIKDVDLAVDLAKALVAGGVRCLEITLRSCVAIDAIRLISQEVPDAIVGVGTVRTAAQLEAASDAGARFAVSPGLTRELSAAARASGIPFLPGIATPSESMFAADQGYMVQKLFPAEAVGGVALLKSIYGPMPDVVFCPTGGINPRNARSYLALPNVQCVGGSWLTPDSVVTNKQWDAITQLAKEACALTGSHA
ncbi:MAG TPA: bifunctional 4-hydroxy-2-oxoglutarate aldolase/2-dehydro-3-deoxy-phosphogluconate aldolase [Burkholderiaceae bacterium]|nr:bifunctional 4-hydroxy-2-oxoglutarate aldolase/2-dehydro-3-deoxy-phosphogluconate aldolase [Burkholderiaceae bacterium]